MKIAVLAMGLADKAVSLFYENRLHREISEIWAGRCRTQILAVLAALQADCASLSGRYWFDDRIGHADIAVAVALRFLGEAHPGLVDWESYPALVAHIGHLEALPVFGEIAQAFMPPA
jgi:glutathione S-transferase